MLYPFIKFNNTMGNKPSSQINNDYNRLLADYDIVQQTKDQGLRYLEHKITKQQYLLREISCHDKQSYKKTQLKLKDRKQQLQGNQYIVSLLKLISTQQDQYCMTYFKIYALWEFPQRTLEDEINERILQKRRFEEKELWSILASSILALSHLQKENIKHNSLKSAALLITSDGIIKLYDPITIGAASNYEILLTHRSSPHLYLSPQQTESLNEQKSTPSCDPYKSDIWTLGMILLQAGLLCYQDECYRDQFSKIRWQTLNTNKNKFQQTYSTELSNLLEFMLAKDERGRPDWAQLQQHVIKVQQDAKGSNVSQTSMQKNKNSIDRVFEQINPHSKAHLQKNDLSVYFDKKPLSSSRSEQKPNQSFMAVNKIYRNDPQMPSSGYLVRPSDISTTRPLRNLFPASTYQTLTKIDENILPQNQKFNLQHQKSAKNQSNHKNIIAHPTPNQQKHSNLKEQAEFVHEIYTQGSRYQGYKVRGLKHGFGRFYYQDGGMYEGNWQENRMTGYGKLYYQSDKLAYQGQWKNDQFDSQGILYNEYPQPLRGQFNYRNFDEIEQHWTKYQGQFVQDMKHGRGILYLANGEYFQGQFRNDYVQGLGTFVSQRGQKIQGRWQNNLML